MALRVVLAPWVWVWVSRWLRIGVYGPVPVCMYVLQEIREG